MDTDRLVANLERKLDRQRTAAKHTDDEIKQATAVAAPRAVIANLQIKKQRQAHAIDITTQYLNALKGKKGA